MEKPCPLIADPACCACRLAPLLWVTRSSELSSDSFWTALKLKDKLLMYIVDMLKPSEQWSCRAVKNADFVCTAPREQKTTPADTLPPSQDVSVNFKPYICWPVQLFFVFFPLLFAFLFWSFAPFCSFTHQSTPLHDRQRSGETQSTLANSDEITSTSDLKPHTEEGPCVSHSVQPYVLRWTCLIQWCFAHLALWCQQTLLKESGFCITNCHAVWLVLGKARRGLHVSTPLLQRVLRPCTSWEQEL